MGEGAVQIYYGEGHGKSMAAIGKAVAAACDGKSVAVIQFLKSKEKYECGFLARLEPEIKFFRFEKSDEAFEQLSEEEKQEERINLRNGFNYGKKVISTGACDMVVLDEILGLIDQDILTTEDIRELLSVKPDEMTVVFTGRVLRESVRALADEIYNIVTEK